MSEFCFIIKLNGNYVPVRCSDEVTNDIDDILCRVNLFVPETGL